MTENNLMENEDSVTILRLARDQTESLQGFDNASTRFARNSVFSLHTENVSMTFAFDQHILGSRVYRAAAKSNFRDLVRKKSRINEEKTRDNDNDTNDYDYDYDYDELIRQEMQVSGENNIT